MENKINIIKLSDFIGDITTRYIHGKKEKVLPEINGDIKFYSLSEIEDGTTVILVLLKRQKEAFEMIDDIKVFTKLTYDIIHILTDIKIDLSFDEYVESLRKSNPLLNDFVADVWAHFNKLATDIVETEETTNKIKETIPKESILERKSKQLISITKNYKEEKDTKVKQTLFVKKAVLTAEIEELKNVEKEREVDENIDK